MTFWQETGELCLKNYMNHLILKDYIELALEVTCDGKILKKGRNGTEGVHTARADRKHFSDIPVPERGKCYLKISYYLKQGNALVVPGSVLGFDEILLKNKKMVEISRRCVFWKTGERIRHLCRLRKRIGSFTIKKREVHISLQ